MMINMSKTNYMIDLESLGLESDAIITQIAVLEFDNEYNETGHLSIRPSVVEQLLAGRSTTESTIQFWNNQPTELVSKMFSEPTMDAGDIMDHFLRFINFNKRDGSELWANGMLFDINMMDSYLMQFMGDPNCTLQGMFQYNKILDLRSIIRLEKVHLKENYKKLKDSIEVNGILHDALADCRWQLEILRKLHLPRK